MNGILSEEASKVQAELDHASKTTASWQQHSSGIYSTVSMLSLLHMLQGPMHLLRQWVGVQTQLHKREMVSAVSQNSKPILWACHE